MSIDMSVTIPKSVFESKLFTGNGRYVIVVPKSKGDISLKPWFYLRGCVIKSGKNNTPHLLMDKYVDYINILKAVANYNKRHVDGMCNVFINCYPDPKHVYMIILDFDGDGDFYSVYEEVSRCYNIVMDKDFNAVIVISGSKGFHLYIQIPCTDFTGHFDDKTFFLEYWKHLINFEQEQYRYLDKNHFRNGLGGNIRLIGSVHPKANGGCTRIFKGEFKNVDCFSSDALEYHDYLLNICDTASTRAYISKQRNIQKRINKNMKIVKQHGFNPQLIDLRDLFKYLYGSCFVKDFRNYSSFKCPFHGEEHASLLVYSDYFICHACGEQGYINRLVSMGVISWKGLKCLYS